MCSLSAVYFSFSLHNILSLGKTTYSIIVCASFQNTLLHIPLISYLPEYLQEVINCKFSLNFKSKRQKSYCKNCHLEKKNSESIMCIIVPTFCYLGVLFRRAYNDMGPLQFQMRWTFLMAQLDTYPYLRYPRILLVRNWIMI